MLASRRKYLNELPSGWVLERLNNVADLYGRIGWQGLTSDEYRDDGPWLVTGTDFKNGSIDWKSCVHISERRWEEAYQIKLEPGDLLITKDGTVGKLAIVENQPGKASLNSGVMRIVPKATGLYSTRYLYFVLQTDVFTEWFKDINSGASTIQHLFQKDFSHFVFPKPPLVEQEAIAQHLAAICREYERVETTLSTQISLLERYRASVIHEAVTKGLDLSVPTKPSGVDWIGDIPETWNTTKIKYRASIRNGLDYSSEDVCDPGEPGATLVVRSSNISNGKMRHADDVFVKMPVSKSMLLGNNDLVIVRANGSSELVGKSALFSLSDRCAAGGFMLICRSKNNRYLRWVLQSDLISFHRGQFDTTTINRLSSFSLGNMGIPWPTSNERKQIADYLDKYTEKVDAILDTKRQQLDVLKRRRQSLIYEYVTGKRRVNGQE